MLRASARSKGSLLRWFIGTYGGWARARGKGGCSRKRIITHHEQYHAIEESWSLQVGKLITEEGNTINHSSRKRAVEHITMGITLYN